MAQDNVQAAINSNPTRVVERGADGKPIKSVRGRLKGQPTGGLKAAAEIILPLYKEAFSQPLAEEPYTAWRTRSAQLKQQGFTRVRRGGGENEEQRDKRLLDPNLPNVRKHALCHQPLLTVDPSCRGSMSLSSPTAPIVSRNQNGLTWTE